MFLYRIIIHVEQTDKKDMLEMTGVQNKIPSVLCRVGAEASVTATGRVMTAARFLSKCCDTETLPLGDTLNHDPNIPSSDTYETFITEVIYLGNHLVIKEAYVYLVFPFILRDRTFVTHRVTINT